MESKTLQLLLLMSLFVTSFSSTTYFITPTPDATCPGKREYCCTLSECTAHGYFDRLLTDTTLHFLPGNHTLETTITLADLTSLTVTGGASSLAEVTSRIICTRPAGFVFTSITELYINALAFISCGQSYSGAINITSVEHCHISSSTFKSSFALPNVSTGGAIYVWYSTLVLTNNLFQNNSAKLGGAIAASYSTLNVTRNTFENNSAWYFGGTTAVWNSILNFTNNTFKNNSAYEGGVLAMVNSELAIMGGIFQENFAQNAGVLLGQGCTLAITNNNFQSNFALTPIGSGGGTLAVSYCTINITGNVFQGNSADYGGALYIGYSTLHLTENTFQDNCAKYGGALNVWSTALTLVRSTFQNNSAYVGGALFAYQSTLSLKGNAFRDNIAHLSGGALTSLTSTMKITMGTFEERTTNDHKAANAHGVFDNNKAQYGGGLYVHGATLSGNMILTKNSATEGGAIYAFRGIFMLNGTTTIANNSARKGGGLLLSGDSQLYLPPETNLYLVNNAALETGGAIRVKETDAIELCIPNVTTECFFQIQPAIDQYLHGCSYPQVEQFIHSLNISMYFENNTATDAGGDLYNGFIDKCVLSSMARLCSGGVPSGVVFDTIASTSKGALPDISSDPLGLCICRGELPEFNVTDYTQSVHPGGTIEVPVIAYGQRNQPTAAVVQVTGISEETSFDYIEYSIGKYCTTLKYTIHSHVVGISQRMILTAKGPCSPGQTVTVALDIKDCPPGFQLPVAAQSCVCTERLREYTDTCLIDNATILRRHNAEFWVGYSSGNDSGLILHPHCPFDYCTSMEMFMKVTNSDKQCSYNRSGILCGKCSENLSLVFGSSRCLQCSNSYLSLLVAFALAGIALVLLLLILRLTVAAGTINGLIFYANIVTVNSTTFFRPKTTNVLTVFIAWLNLDLGIETCFYNGMDAYVKAWLQFAFPLYVWGLVGMMIIISHYSARMARMFGRNPVAVLATLFLLSYTKLLRTAIAALSYTTLEISDSNAAVWLYDGNIGYVSKKHLPLFLAALASLMFLSLPYTTLLTVAQWLQAKSEWRVLSWINSRYIIPFLDAYHAPYSTKHRYWVGLMLLLRFVLLLISAVNALGDPRINLLAVGSSLILVTPAMLASTRIYKSAYLCLLEVSFLVNLSILVLTTLYIYPNEANQNAVTFTSVSIALATFIGVVIYHSIQQIKVTQLWRKLFLRHEYISIPLDDEDEPEDPPDRVYVSGHAPTETVVDIREVRQQRGVGRQETCGTMSRELQELESLTWESTGIQDTVELREPCMAMD